MRHKQPLFFMIVCTCLLLACGQIGSGSSTAAPSLPTRQPAASIPATSVSQIPPPTIATAEATATHQPTATVPQTPNFPPPAGSLPPFPRLAPDAIQWTVLKALQQATAPIRDDLALAAAYRGYSDHIPPSVPTPILGDVVSFNLVRVSDNSLQPIDMTLAAVGTHAYFWFENSYLLTAAPSASLLESAARTFDEIYIESRRYFGEESNPGIDNDPRIHIVHATSATLCGQPAGCAIAGYFSPRDALPRAAIIGSNERDMFVMNASHFGTSFYASTLAHEFRHMIESNHDRSETDWAIEGSATLAEALLGYTDSPTLRANLFLANPNRTLNDWPDENRIAAYGHGYLLSRYIFDRLGPTLFQAFVSQPADGLAAIDSLALAHGLALTGDQLWLDWLVALGLLGTPTVPAHYAISGPNLDAVARDTIRVGDYQAGEVHQYGATYLALEGSGPATINFVGGTQVALMEVQPTTGRFMWLTKRGNFQNPRLTRAVDLSHVSSATLTFDVYHDIEIGFDYAYVSVSTDGGNRWEGVTATSMQGNQLADDPGQRALTERFYTGKSLGWRSERIDLTPYAGQQIYVRFEYVTDLVLTESGLAIDNITIPEIGFYDTVETVESGWIAEGFIRVTGYIPQRWQLQLITFDSGIPNVTTIPVTRDYTASLTLDLKGDTPPPLLIIAAMSPQTLLSAPYQVTLSQ